MNESDSQRRTRSLETKVASELRALVEGIPLGAEFTVVPSASLCYSLEYFIPQLLRRQHLEWERESLDGIFVARARKTGPLAAQLAGTCILISDQTVTPFMISLASSPSGDTITSFRVQLGEPGGGALGISGPECNSQEARVLLATLVARLDAVAWSYTIASAEDRP